MSPISLSDRASRTPPSPIRKLAPLARAAEAAGTRVYHLNIGQPDIHSPREFHEGLDLYKQSVIAYDASEGRSETRTAWSKFMNSSLGLHTEPDQFLITTGASEALIFAFMACCDPGDEVLIFDPSYANYIGFAAISGVQLAPVACTIENGFALPPVDKILARITDKTKAILLCNPNNPTGTVYTRAEVQLLLEICESENLFLIVDEAYREFVYDGLQPLSVFHLEPDNDRVIVVDSLSKRFSLCGARIGALISTNEEFLAATLKIAQSRLSSPSIEQFAAAHMLRNITPAFIRKVQAEYQMRRDVLVEAFGAIPGVVVKRPQGAFYAVVRLPVADADHFARFMLESFSDNGRTTFVAPAQGFYLTPGRGRDEVRIAYVLHSDDIRIAAAVLSNGLASYQAIHSANSASSARR